MVRAITFTPFCRSHLPIPIKTPEYPGIYELYDNFAEVLFTIACLYDIIFWTENTTPQEENNEKTELYERQIRI